VVTPLTGIELGQGATDMDSVQTISPFSWTAPVVCSVRFEKPWLPMGLWSLTVPLDEA
jgi:hypothetical protein